MGKSTLTLVDLPPSGRFLMEDFYSAGGLPGVMRRMGEGGLLPHKGALTRGFSSFLNSLQCGISMRVQS